MNVLMTCVVLVFNYIGRKYFVFKFENPEENLDKESVDEKNTSE